MEMVLNIELFICEVVNEGSLLNIIVLSIDSYVLHLFFGVSQMSKLLLLGNISPHAAKLLGLISCVHIVEDCELRTNKVGEVSDFDVTKVECNQILVMEYHTTNPLIVGPTS